MAMWVGLISRYDRRAVPDPSGHLCELLLVVHLHRSFLDVSDLEVVCVCVWVGGMWEGVDELRG